MIFTVDYQRFLTVFGMTNVYWLATLKLPGRAEVVPYPTDLPLLLMQKKLLPGNRERDREQSLQRAGVGN